MCFASLTSYAIFLTEFGKDFAGGASAALGYVFQALTKIFFGVGQGSDITALWRSDQFALLKPVALVNHVSSFLLRVSL